MRYVLIFSLFFSLLYGGVSKDNKDFQEVKRYLQSIKDIGKELKSINIDRLENPFLRKSMPASMVVDERDEIVVKTYRLSAIMLNRAKIDGKWYKKGSRVDGRTTLIAIKENHIVLEGHNGPFKVKLAQVKDRNIVLSK
jgi:hypothetical protein